jgi:hypothetical protein
MSTLKVGRAAAVLTALVVTLLAACGGTGCPYRESIVFSEGLRGAVDLACPDGSVVGVLLSPTSAVAFGQVAGSSLQSPLVLTVLDETAPSPTEAERVGLYNPLTSKLSYFPGLSGVPGWYAMDVDGNRVAFEYFTHLGPPFVPAALLVADLRSGQTSALLTLPSNVQLNAPTWRPDGREILFIRLDVSSYPRILPSLAAVSYPEGQTTTLFGPDVGVEGVAFSPDGKRFAMWTSKGLELVEEDTLHRTVVLPISKLAGRQLDTAGLIWGARDKLIAFVLYDPTTGQSQLWDVRPDGTGLRMVYSVVRDRLFLGSFVTGPWSVAHPYPSS